MKITDWTQFSQDDLLDESTVELFRQYLREVLAGKPHANSRTLTWADN